MSSACALLSHPFAWHRSDQSPTVFGAPQAPWSAASAATASPVQTQQGQGLEEDDDFIEYDDEGVVCAVAPVAGSGLPAGMLMVVVPADWREEDDDPRNAELWARSWDDECMQEEYSQQLRGSLAGHQGHTAPLGRQAAARQPRG